LRGALQKDQCRTLGPAKYIKIAREFAFERIVPTALPTFILARQCRSRARPCVRRGRPLGNLDRRTGGLRRGLGVRRGLGKYSAPCGRSAPVRAGRAA
jgi:hypothetical protein